MVMTGTMRAHWLINRMYLMTFVLQVRLSAALAIPTLRS